MNQTYAYEKSVDLAETVLYYRREKGALPTIELMGEFIRSEVKSIEIWTMTEDRLREAGEWFDRECEPE